MAALEPRGDELFPDVGELLDARAEEVDPLATGDLGVEGVLLGDLTESDELIGGDLPGRHARHDRIGPVLLDVGEEAVVGVLEGPVALVEDGLVEYAGQDAGHRRLADLAAAALAVLGDEPGEGADRRARPRSGIAPAG